MEDGSSPLWGLIVFMLLIVVEILFYGFAAAIQTIHEHQLEEKAENGNKKAVRILQLMNEPMHFVNTLQVISVLAGILTGIYVVRRTNKWIMPVLVNKLNLADTGQTANLSAAVMIIVMVFLLVTLGVAVPKKIAAKYPEKWAFRLVDLMYIVTFLFRPFTYLIGMTSHVILKLFGIDSFASEDDVTEEGIISMVNEGQEQGVIEDSEAEMIQNIFELGDKEASDIMTHRKHVIALDGELTLDEVLEYILEQSFSRFPVYEGDLDNVIGILHLKDAMKCHRKEELRVKQIQEIKELIRPVAFIPETRNINMLFQNMQSQKMHMAIVVDEYGQTAGLIAMEDILEEIVGNILDEYDEEENFILPHSDHSWIVKGMTPLEELEEEIGFFSEEEDYDTLNGFLISLLDRIPGEDEVIEIEHGDYVFKVLSVKDKMIQNVLIIKR